MRMVIQAFIFQRQERYCQNKYLDKKNLWRLKKVFSKNSFKEKKL